MRAAFSAEHDSAEPGEKHGQSQEDLIHAARGLWGTGIRFYVLAEFRQYASILFSKFGETYINYANRYTIVIAGIFLPDSLLVPALTWAA